MKSFIYKDFGELSSDCQLLLHSTQFIYGLSLVERGKALQGLEIIQRALLCATQLKSAFLDLNMSVRFGHRIIPSFDEVIIAVIEVLRGSPVDPRPKSLERTVQHLTSMSWSSMLAVDQRLTNISERIVQRLEDLSCMLLKIILNLLDVLL